MSLSSCLSLSKRLLSVAAIAALLLSCGGGGGGGGGGGASPAQTTVEPPFIAAELDSFPPASIPTGFNTGASVVVQDGSSGDSIATATVAMNAVNLTYNAANEDYEGNVVVAPGGTVTLSVTVAGRTYTPSPTQFTSSPVISTPASGATWDSSVTNTVTWSSGFPTTNASYALGVLDAADPNGGLIWPLDNFLHELPM